MGKCPSQAVSVTLTEACFYKCNVHKLFFSLTCSLQQLEDRQQATARYENRKRDVNYWLDNMESRLDQLDLAPEESETVEIQIQQLRVSHN